mmetsp:Transcript_64263/g.167092  ORF Transcript_64263/g.167092 Transcript_64263/m.167092 type:complete len:213 (-) Transcript_64263:305-943(-)
MVLNIFCLSTSMLSISSIFSASCLLFFSSFARAWSVSAVLARSSCCSAFTSAAAASEARRSASAASSPQAPLSSWADLASSSRWRASWSLASASSARLCASSSCARRPAVRASASSAPASAAVASARALARSASSSFSYRSFSAASFCASGLVAAAMSISGSASDFTSIRASVGLLRASASSFSNSAMRDRAAPSSSCSLVVPAAAESPAAA